MPVRSGGSAERFARHRGIGRGDGARGGAVAWRCRARAVTLGGWSCGGRVRVPQGPVRHPSTGVGSWYPAEGFRGDGGTAGSGERPGRRIFGLSVWPWTVRRGSRLWGPSVLAVGRLRVQLLVLHDGHVGGKGSIATDGSEGWSGPRREWLLEQVRGAGGGCVPVLCGSSAVAAGL